MKMGHTMGPRLYGAAPRDRSRECVMSYNPYFDSMPRQADKWIPQDPDEININDERELTYWCNELRISIGDLIWLVEKHGTASERIRALGKWRCASSRAVIRGLDQRIHVFLECNFVRRGWPALKPAMTNEKLSGAPWIPAKACESTRPSDGYARESAKCVSSPVRLPSPLLLFRLRAVEHVLNRVIGRRVGRALGLLGEPHISLGQVLPFSPDNGTVLQLGLGAHFGGQIHILLSSAYLPNHSHEHNVTRPT